MSIDVLDRGPGPKGFGAGRDWAATFTTRKMAGLAGEGLAELVKGDVKRNGDPTMAVRCLDVRQCFCSQHHLRAAAEELNREGSNKVDSSSSMCLLFFFMRF
ncbi:hypothetical protein F2Q69_00053539 [Brassica cretica]|uniref:Uncharacterized protein n=1 Tax=Brassica cretica TaxID=69181 RepID=A0A8S9MVL4_BRACR|nr:hypothetical protein F2Q69_00053539 [Brassica cretica]